MRRLSSHPLPAVALAVTAVIAACSSKGGDTAAASGAPTARFAFTAGTTPNFLDVPFPSDVYLDASGHFVNPLPGVERMVTVNGDVVSTQLAHDNGWSRIAPAFFPIDDNDPAKPLTDTDERPGDPLDRTSLPVDETACVADTSAVFLVDLEPADPAATRVACRAMILDETSLQSGRVTLGVGPARGVVLEEGHHYAAVVTSRVKDKAGAKITKTAAFEAAAKDGSNPYGAAYAKVMAAIGPALASDGAEIVALAPYTTQNVSAELFQIRDDLEAAAAPPLTFDAASMAPMGATRFAAKVAGTLPAGFTASLDDWLGVATKKLDDGSDDPDEQLDVRAHDKIAAVGTGVFAATNYLQVKPTAYDDLDHATFARDASGKPIPAPEAPTAKIWMTFAVPTAPMPATGYPVVIVQHGLSGSRDFLLSLANRFASKGWMAVAIDSVTFGARAADPKYQVDEVSTFGKPPGATYDGPDGFADLVDGSFNGAFQFFGELKNLGALRDQLRQAAIDTAQVVKVLRSKPDLSTLKTGTDAPVIDPDRIAYFGDSLGGIEGATAAAIEPGVKAWTLNVAGGGVASEIAAHGPTINVQLALAGSVNFGIRGTTFSEGHPLVSLIQTMIEAGDPMAYVKHVVLDPHALAGAATSSRNVLQTEVVFDELVANEGCEALARAGGWGMTAPNVGPNSGVFDLGAKSPYPGGGITLTMLPAAAEGYHDTPKAGVTAVLAQMSPGQHGEDAYSSKGKRTFTLPFNTADGLLASVTGTPTEVPCEYRALQDSILGFFDDAFAGKVPVVKGLPAPVRDADGDGKPDDSDPAPLDPAH